MSGLHVATVAPQEAMPRNFHHYHHHHHHLLLLKIMVILLGPCDETAHIPGVNTTHNTPLLPALISFAASSSSTSPEYHDFHFHHLWTFTISFVCGAQSHNRGSTETGRAITITTTCEKGPRAGLIVALKQFPKKSQLCSHIQAICQAIVQKIRIRYWKRSRPT